jgi:hypothetical protein
MKPKPSDKLQSHDAREQSYWHMAQDIAFRAGARLEIRGSEVYLVTNEAADFISAPERPNKFWYETWLVLHQRFSELSRLWPGYVPR